MSVYQPVIISPLRGLNLDENPHSLERGDLIDATNAARRATNRVGHRPAAVRPGLGEDYENAMTGTPVIQGAFEYRQDFDTGRRLITVADLAGVRRLWYEDASQVPAGGPPVIALGADNPISMANHENLLWGTGRDASDDIWTWDGNIASAPTVQALTDKGTTNRLRPRHIFSYKGYLLMNGLTGAVASDNPAVTRYCDFATDPTTDANWNDGNTIGFGSTTLAGIDTFGQNFATGFARYEDNEGQFLVLLGSRGNAACVLDPSSDFQVTDGIPNGSVGERSWVSLGVDAGDAVYFGSHGIHSLRQSQQFGGREGTFLSKKIEPVFNALNKARLWQVTGAYDRKNGLVVFAVPFASDTANTRLYALDVRDPESLTADGAMWYGPWFLKDASGNTLNVTQLSYMRSDTVEEPYLYAFTDNGDVLRFDETVFADLGTVGYQVAVQTHHDDMGVLGTEKRQGDLYVQIGPGGTHRINVQTIFDYGNRRGPSKTLQQLSKSTSLVGSSTVGSAKVSASERLANAKAYMGGKGQTISYRFEHGVADEPYFIGKIDSRVKGSGEGPDASAE